MNDKNPRISESPISRNAPAAQQPAATEITTPKNHTRGKVAATLAGAVVGVSSLFHASDIQAKVHKPSDAQVLQGTVMEKREENAAIAALRFPKFVTLQSLKDAIRSGKMEHVKDGQHYTLIGIGEKDPANKVTYASLRPHTKKLLNNLAQKFYQKFKKKWIVTSLARTEAYVDILRKTNKNASKTSTHMYGTTFDVAKNSMSPAQLAWMRTTLADMERLGEIVATEEWSKRCFHIVDTRANK